MKKIVILLSLVLLTGCGNSRGVFEKACDKMSALTSLSMDVTVKLEGKSGDVNINLQSESHQLIDLANEIVAIDATVNFGTSVLATNQFDKIENGTMTSYYKTADSTDWSKITGSTSKNRITAFSDILSLVKSAKNIKKVKSEETGLTKYEIKLDVENVLKLLSLSSEEENTNVVLEGTIPLYLYTDQENRLVKGIMDLKNHVVLASESADTIDTYEITYTFYDFDATTVTIPEEALALE